MKPNLPRRLAIGTDVLREGAVNKLVIDPGKLRECGLNVLAQLDVPGKRGQICVDSFLFGSLRGIDTHSVS